MSQIFHILVVDDHREIRDLLAKYFAAHGYKVSLANGGEEMRTRLRDPSIKLVILDILMPGEDGLSLCRSLRETSSIPVIFLSAVAEDADRIAGLELGADDYVVKPFNPRELLARVKAILRRTREVRDFARGGDYRSYGFGNWILDVKRRVLSHRSGQECELASAEFNLLLAFVGRPGVTLSRDQLLDITAGRVAAAFDRSIDNLVSRLRHKIEDDVNNPVLIKTIWGQGYVLSTDVVTLT